MTNRSVCMPRNPYYSSKPDTLYCSCVISLFHQFDSLLTRQMLDVKADGIYLMAAQCSFM